jgi:hypothetical protein
VPGLVVVARVVEEVDAGLARGHHDLDALVAADPFVGAPRSEGQPADLDTAAAEGLGRQAHAGSVSPTRLGAVSRNLLA